MKVSAARLLKRLSPQGFETSWVDNGVHEVAVARRSEGQDLFEVILVKGQGKRGEAVWADVRASVVRGRAAWTWLSERECLKEIGTDPERGWSIIESIEAAHRWEGLLAEVAPPRAAALAAEKGPDLLKRTEAARAAAARYASKLAWSGNLEEGDRWLRERATPEQVKEAERIAGWIGIVRVVGGLPLYQVAALAMVLFGDEVEGRKDPFLGVDPLDDRDTFARIQILADRLMAPDRENGPLFVESG